MPIKEENGTVIIDGIEWEPCGPYCELCGANMGRLYNEDHRPTHINPYNHKPYDEAKCPKCGQKYHYDEAMRPSLTDEQLALLLSHRHSKGGDVL